MSDLTDRLRSAVNFYAESSQWYDRDLSSDVDEAADELDRLRVQCKMLQDDKAALMAELDAEQERIKGLNACLSEWEDYCADGRLDTLVAERDALRERVEGLERDAARYRWLCGNNFDKHGVTQVHTWLHTWEPHSQTGEPTEWMQRVRGGKLDEIIDAALKGASHE